MRLAHVYLLLAILGAVVPYVWFIPFVAKHGPDVPTLLFQLFGNRTGQFIFAPDMLLSAVILVIFILVEGSRLGLRRLWLPIAATILVGVSLGLPLFLYMRQRRLDAQAPVGR